MNSAIVNAITFCWLASPAPYFVIETPLAASRAMALQTSGSASDSNDNTVRKYIVPLSPSSKVPHPTVPRNTAPAAELSGPTGGAFGNSKISSLSPRALQYSQQINHTPSDNRKAYFDPDLMHLIPPSAPLVLGQAYNLRLELKNPGLTTVHVTQKDVKNAQAIHGGDVIAPVVRHSNGDISIAITPLRLGSVDFQVAAIFPDGGMCISKISVQVEEPTSPPLKLVTTSILKLSLDRPNGDGIVPRASYEGRKEPLLIDAHFVRFSIRTQNGREVISLDPATGVIKPLRVGHALVETHFEGLTAKTCIVVGENDRMLERTSSYCEELLAPGEKLPGMR